LLRRNIMRQIMIDSIERTGDTGGWEGGGWRGVLSAWALVLLFLLALAAVGAVACPRGGSQPHHHLAGAVIPQHDPCTGLGIPSAPGVDGCKTIPVSQDRSAYW
jgi:hypothetical protein